MYKTVKYEEKKDELIKKELNLLREHGRAMSFFIYMFIGFVIAFSFWFIVLPSSIVQNLFSTQLFTISLINNAARSGAVSGLLAFISSNATSKGLLLNILTNNLKVLFFCIFFSFFYGAGAIFILAWNASVISAAVGTFVRSRIEIYAAKAGLLYVAAYAHIFSIGLMRYMTHGIFEILAYFIGGLAGSLISVAIVRHEIGSKEFNKVMIDSLDLILLAVFCVIFAGIVEVYITPLLF